MGRRYIVLEVDDDEETGRKRRKKQEERRFVALYERWQVGKAVQVCDVCVCPSVIPAAAALRHRQGCASNLTVLETVTKKS